MTETRKPRKLELAAGIAVLGLTLITGASDLGLGLDKWDDYNAVALGDPLPEFSVELDDGTPLTPASLQGQVSLLTFWATWCHACDLEMPTIIALDEHYGDELHVYGVNRDSGEPNARRIAVQAHMIKKGMAFPQIYDDGELAQAFAVDRIPYMVLVDKKGEIRHLHLGRVSERTLRGEIDTLLAE